MTDPVVDFRLPGKGRAWPVAIVALGLLGGCGDPTPEERLTAAGEALEDSSEELSRLEDRIEQTEDILAQLRDRRRALRDEVRTREERLAARATEVALFRAVQSALLEDSGLAKAAVSVSVEEGKVTLSGVVGSDAAADRAVEIARETAGVAAVRSRLRVREPGRRQRRHRRCVPGQFVIATAWPMPATTVKRDGVPRRVGVEFELQGVPIGELARLTARTLGGTVEEISIAEFRIAVPGLDDYRVEVDYARLKQMAREQGEAGEEDTNALDSIALDILNSVSSVIVPSEIVTPPIPMEELPEPMERLTNAIRDAGGKGTRSSPFYAFGLHLNVEPPAMDAATVTAFVKAFVCLFDWLVWQGEVDLSRRATPYIQRFPGDYELLVTDPAYWPDRETLIRDYLEWNATRNRALDMLPMLAEMDEEAVRAEVDDDRVKARPAFHYRLANCAIDEPEWSIADPWRRWLQIEHLAENRDALDECCRALHEDRDRFLHRLDNTWRETVTRWLREF